MEMTMEQLPSGATVQAAQILARSVVMKLSCGQFGVDRRVDPEDVDVTARREGEADAEVPPDKVNGDAIRITKALIDRSELARGGHIIQEAKEHLRRAALRGQRVFGAGTYIVPASGAVDVDQRLLALSADLKAWKLTVPSLWPEILERARVKLGPLFNEKQYPTAEKAARCYYIHWSYISFAAPDQLENIDASLARRANEDFQRRCVAAHETVFLELRQRTADVLTELANRLTPGPDGKTKTLRATALRDLEDLVARLPQLDITGDDALADLMAGVVARSQGLDVDVLRKNDAVRDILGAAAREAASAAVTLVETAKRRAIALDGLF